MTITKLGFTDALFMTVITLTTVGYREVAPLGPAGQYFTMVLLVSGLGVVIYSATLLARDAIEGELQRGFGRRRVQRAIEKASGHIVVCGFGRMGRMVCRDSRCCGRPCSTSSTSPRTPGGSSLQIEEVEVTPGSFCDGVTLEGSGLREATGLIVIAVRRPDGDTTFNPTADTPIAAGDRIVLMGQTASLHDIEQRLRAVPPLARDLLS